jgi:hypothetical protein
MLSTGIPARRAFLFLPQVKELHEFKTLGQIQRSYIGKVKMEGYQPKYEDVRDVTAIVVAEQK